MLRNTLFSIYILWRFFVVELDACPNDGCSTSVEQKIILPDAKSVAFHKKRVNIKYFRLFWTLRLPISMFFVALATPLSSPSCKLRWQQSLLMLWHPRLMPKPVENEAEAAGFSLAPQKWFGGAAPRPTSIARRKSPVASCQVGSCAGSKEC